MILVRTWCVLIIFFIGLAVFCFSFFNPLLEIFWASPYINGVILSTLFFGIGFSFVQIIRLQKADFWLKTHWGKVKIDIYKIKLPSLLYPFKDKEQASSRQIFSSRSQAQYLCDEIASDVDNSRDISKYIMGLLIFLGLAGTFWGLAIMVNGMMQTIIDLESTKGGIPLGFEAIKKSLQSPLKGMGVSFTASFFGFVGFIIFGFMELLTNGVRRYFIGTLEGWFNKIIEEIKAVYKSVPPGDNQDAFYSQAVLSSIVKTMESLKDTRVEEQIYHKELTQIIGKVSDRLASLTDQVRIEQRLMMKLAESHIALQGSLKGITKAAVNGGLGLDKISKGDIKSISLTVQQISEFISSGDIMRDIKQELRFLTKAIGLASPEKSKKIFKTTAPIANQSSKAQVLENERSNVYAPLKAKHYS